jgi:hypothetical protein
VSVGLFCLCSRSLLTLIQRFLQCFEEGGGGWGEAGGGGGRGEALPAIQYSQMLNFVVKGVAVFVAVVPEGSNLKKNSMYWFLYSK